MKVELNLTEQLFASHLGIRTILFRPPYSVDAEPDTEDQVRPLELTQSMGYITVGNKLDTKDWNDDPPLTPQQIAAEVLDHLPPCRPNDTRTAATSFLCTMAAAIASAPCSPCP